MTEMENVASVLAVLSGRKLAEGATIEIYTKDFIDAANAKRKALGFGPVDQPAIRGTTEAVLYELKATGNGENIQ